MNDWKLLRKLSVFILAQIWIINISGQPIYFIENQAATVNISEINGTDFSQFNINSIGLYGIAADYKNNKIYYTNVVTDEIFSANFDGSDPVVLLNKNNDGVDGPRGITIDNKNDRIFWAEVISGKIRSADLDGNNVSDVVTGLGSPVDVTLDLENDLLYWTDNDTFKKKIFKSDLIGTVLDSIYIGQSQLGSIELDIENQKLYFLYLAHIYKINTDFTSPSIFVFIADGSTRGLAIDRYSSKLFWTDVSDSSLSSINLDGTLNSKIVTVLDHPMSIAADNPATLPILVELKTMLEGPYNLVDDLMTTEILDSLPTKSPYTENPRIVDNIPTNITDWALVELRETLNGPAVASKSVVLHQDGRLVADDGSTSTIRISVEPKDYYIVVKHRNHLPIMSNSKINLTTN